MSVGVAGLFLRPSSRWPRRFLLAVVAGYWFVATSTGAALLVAGLGRGFVALHSREEARGAEAVVVLGGGSGTVSGGGHVVGVLTPQSILRALEGARVAKLIGAKLVVASGGEPRPDLQERRQRRKLDAGRQWPCQSDRRRRSHHVPGGASGQSQHSLRRDLRRRRIQKSRWRRELAEVQ
jgi:uncharacterized SAM-binding protein YcdF (DUF218 family)